MKKRIIGYFYDSEEQHKEYEYAELLVMTAMGVTVINTIIRFIVL